MAWRRASGSAIRRTPREWPIRGALALAALPFAYLGVTHSLALAAMAGNAEQAYALAPYDGRLAAHAAALRLVDKQSDAAHMAAGLARQALRRDPTAVEAVATLGYVALAQGDTADARRLFAYAEKLSRRDLQTQLWAIEDASAAGDVPRTLRHYDIALRTNTPASDLLFPILTQAIAMPEVRSGLVTLLAKRPVWGPRFIVHVAGKGQQPEAGALFFIALYRAGVPIPDDATAALINTLVANDAGEDAWRLYQILHPGTDRRRSRNGRFEGASGTPSLFDWTPVNDAGVSASILSGDHGLFDFAVSPSVGGVVLQQMQALTPGTYRLRGHAIGIAPPAAPLLYWMLSCHNGREVGRIAISPSAQASGMFEGRFTVPTDCPLQMLSLMARPSDTPSGVSGQIDRVQLEPAT